MGDVMSYRVAEVQTDNHPGNGRMYQAIGPDGPLADGLYSHPDGAWARIDREQETHA